MCWICPSGNAGAFVAWRRRWFDEERSVGLSASSEAHECWVFLDYRLSYLWIISGQVFVVKVSRWSSLESLVFGNAESAVAFSELRNLHIVGGDLRWSYCCVHAGGENYDVTAGTLRVYSWIWREFWNNPAAGHLSVCCFRHGESRQYADCRVIVTVV